MTRRNRREGKQDHLLARLRPSQAMATGISSRRIDRDYPMIGRAAFGRAPRSLRDLSFQRNHSKIGSSHSPTYVPPSTRASTKFRRRIRLVLPTMVRRMTFFDGNEQSATGRANFFPSAQRSFNGRTIIL